MSQKIIERYISRYTNHRELITLSGSIGSWQKATVIGVDALTEFEVWFRVSKKKVLVKKAETVKFMVEYGVLRDGRIIKCDEKYLL